MSITLRTNKNQGLTLDEMDINLTSYYYSSSVRIDNNNNKYLRLHYTGSQSLGSGQYIPRFDEIKLSDKSTQLSGDQDGQVLILAQNQTLATGSEDITFRGGVLEVENSIEATNITGSFKGEGKDLKNTPDQYNLNMIYLAGRGEQFIPWNGDTAADIITPSLKSKRLIQASQKIEEVSIKPYSDLEGLTLELKLYRVPDLKSGSAEMVDITAPTGAVTASWGVGEDYKVKNIDVIDSTYNKNDICAIGVLITPKPVEDTYLTIGVTTKMI